MVLWLLHGGIDFTLCRDLCKIFASLPPCLPSSPGLQLVTGAAKVFILFIYQTECITTIHLEYKETHFLLKQTPPHSERKGSRKKQFFFSGRANKALPRAFRTSKKYGFPPPPLSGRATTNKLFFRLPGVRLCASRAFPSRSPV